MRLVKKIIMFIVYMYAALLAAILLVGIAMSEISVAKKIIFLLVFGSLIHLGIRYSDYLKRKKIEMQKQKEETQKQKEEYIQKIYKEIENNLQPIEINIKLTKDEEAFFKLDNVHWQELRKERTSVSYAGLSQTITIAKGLRFKVGNITPIQHSNDTIKTIETGTLYLTSKSILLVSKYTSKKINLDKIIETSIYSDAVKIQRQTGKAVFLPMDFENMVRFSIILDKCLA